MKSPAPHSLPHRIFLSLNRWRHNIATKPAIDLSDPVARSAARDFTIGTAQPADIPEIVAMIRALAEFEKLSHLCVAGEEDLRRHLFAPAPKIEVVIGKESGAAACFALFFHNFSTFLGRPGLYLEDLFVRPEFRRKGYGRALLAHLARLAVDRGCGRFEWSVLDWNEPAIAFYQSLGAAVLPEWRITRVTGASLQTLARGG